MTSVEKEAWHKEPRKGGIAEVTGGEAGFHEGAEKAHTRQKSGSNPDGKLGSHGRVQPHQPPKQCPECGSTKTWKDGIRYTNRGQIQRYLCRSCGFRFSESTTKLIVKRDVLRQFSETPNAMDELTEARVRNCDFAPKKSLNELSFPLGENVTPHSKRTNIPTVGKALYTFQSNSGNRRVCVSEVEMKNLAEVESRTEKRAAGATKPTPEEVKGKIVEYAWWMKKQGYAETTIVNRSGILRRLVKRGANLFDPESVKDVIAQQNCSEGTKLQMVCAYNTFATMVGLKWEPPCYKQTDKIPFIPTEQEIDQLIAGCGKKTATLLRTLKETAMRVGEAWRLRWTDIDFEKGLIRLNTPEKRSNPRILRISKELVAMLNRLPRNNQKVFANTSLRGQAASFRVQRRRVAAKLQNPRILQISFHTLRHWKATMEYHRTKDILHVKELLGHKRIDNTLIYIQLEKAIFQSQNDEWTVKVAKSVEEACQLVEAGFEYVTGEYADGGKIFRKRK